MNEQEWLSQAKSKQDKLVQFVRAYHPSNLKRKSLPITAMVAEKACENVRNEINKNWEGEPGNELIQAIEANNLNRVNKILNDAWFGVPESTSCWQIPGFKEAVELMEDLPD